VELPDQQGSWAQYSQILSHWQETETPIIRKNEGVFWEMMIPAISETR